MLVLLQYLKVAFKSQDKKFSVKYEILRFKGGTKATPFARQEDRNAQKDTYCR